MEGLLKKDGVATTEMVSILGNVSDAPRWCIREIESRVENWQGAVGWLSSVVRVGLMFLAFMILNTDASS